MMSNWNTPEGTWIAERMLACAGILVYFDDGAWYVEGHRVLDRDAELNFNDAARQLGEKHSMFVAPERNSTRYQVWRFDTSDKGQSVLAIENDHTAACMAMAELALKEEGR